MARAEKSVHGWMWWESSRLIASRSIPVSVWVIVVLLFAASSLACEASWE